MKKTFIITTALILIACLPVAVSLAAGLPQPLTDEFTEQQQKLWAIFIGPVYHGITQTSNLLYDETMHNVDMETGVTELATAMVSNTLDVKGVLTPGLSDTALLTTAFHNVTEFEHVILADEIGNQINDMLFAALQACNGNYGDVALYCSTHSVSSIVRMLGAFQLWELSDKILLSSALSDLMYSYYALGGDLDKIIAHYGLTCNGEDAAKWDCIVQYFSQTNQVDFNKLKDKAYKIMRSIDKTYHDIKDRELITPSAPELYPVANNVNPGSIVFSWSPCSCRKCGIVRYNLEVHQGDDVLFKADDYTGDLISGTTYALPVSLDPDSTYSWAVFPCSQYGVWNLDVVWENFTTGQASGNHPPEAVFSLSPLVGDTATVFSANADSSSDPDQADTLQYSWKWENEDTYTAWSSDATASHTYGAPGNYVITLRVTDGHAISYQSKTIAVTQANAPPGRAINISPGDGTENLPVDTCISWSNGGGATSFDICFGTSPDFTDADKINQTGTRFSPGGLRYNTTYFFRVDSVNQYGITPGETWSFTTMAPPPWINYYYWDFDTNGTEGWEPRNAVSNGIFQQDYWIIDPVSDPASKSGIISPDHLTGVNTDHFDTIEVRAAIVNAYVDTLDVYLKINGMWKPPFTLHHVSGAITPNSQCVYSGDIPYSGQIERVRIDFVQGSDTQDDRVFVDRVNFLKINTAAAVIISGYVKDARGSAVEGVSIDFGTPGIAMTNYTGYYRMELSSGWSGTLTPSKPFYSFMPGSISFDHVTSSARQDFIATNVPETINTIDAPSGSGTVDGCVFNHGMDSYSSVVSASSGNEVTSPGNTIMLTAGQDKALSGEYYVYRASVPIDTSDVPDNCVITGATLYLYGYGHDYSDTDFDIEIVQSSQQSSSGLALTDFSRFGDIFGGSLNTSGWQGNNAINAIRLNSTGLSWINKKGVTIFGIRSSRDINQTEPAHHEFVNFWSAQAAQAADFHPFLKVEYTTSHAISSAEYFIDTDPGAGNGIPINAADGYFDSNMENFSFPIDTSNLSVGPHYVFIRMKNEQGVWGICNKKLFMVTGFTHVADAEFFIDHDPGQGAGTPVPAADGLFDESSENLGPVEIDTSGLDEGMHTLYVRVKNSEGKWGTPRAKHFEVSSPATIARAECFFDVDPGEGNGIPVSAVDGGMDQGTENLAAQIDTSGLELGDHILYIRAEDSSGRWTSPVESQSIHVFLQASITGLPDNISNTGDGALTIQGEGIAVYKYKIDDRAFGGETPVNQPISLSGLTDSVHTVYVSGGDGNGTWQPQPITYTFTVDTTPPVAVFVSGMPDAVSTQKDLTIIIGGTDVVKYKFSLDDGPYGDAYAIDDPLSLMDITDGEHRLKVIGRDSAGNWQPEASCSEIAWQANVTPDNAPAATNQFIVTSAGQAVAVTLAGTDVDAGDTLTFLIAQNPEHGKITGRSPDYTYTPDAGYTGPDYFTFRANDGLKDSEIAIVSIAINPEDSDGDGVSDADDICPGTPAGNAVYSNGCTADDIYTTIHQQEEQIEQLKNDVKKWDINNDGKKGLPEAIDALKTVSGVEDKP